jgi:DNA-binding winged helix-turn-helix (wHTH) protein
MGTVKIAFQAGRRADSLRQYDPESVRNRFVAAHPDGQRKRMFHGSVIARAPGTMGCNAYRFGGFVLDLDRGMLLAGDGTERALRPKSFDLLRLLVENAGRLLSQQFIIEALWPATCVTDNSVSQCVRDIRRALGPADAAMLRTMPRRGYLFTPQVTVSQAMAPAAIAERDASLR